jgi:5-oxoprolinase (ATP-hydrolysing) subunit C
MSGSLIIQQPGNSVVTDLGRFRGPRFGLPVNGALDQYSARAANILAGNEDNAPLLEITALDFRMRATTDTLIAVTGAPLHLTVGGRECQQWEPVSVRAGETVALRRIDSGLRAYVAVHGSVKVPVLLGSCAPDTVVGFGLRLTEGTELKTFHSVPPIRQPYFDLPLFRLGLTRPEFNSSAVVEVTDGPDVDEFGDTADLLYSTEYTVSGRSNHIGLRLGGALPERQSNAEVLSRGVPVGAIEVPSRQELLVLHRGRGVTAGYPVLAVVTSRSLDVLAQSRPGHKITFRRTTVPEATAKHRAVLRELETLRSTIGTVFPLLGIGEQPGRTRLAPAAGS